MGGFAMLYDTFANLETLGVCRRGYFIEGMGGAQFALPGAVERLRSAQGRRAGRAGEPPRALVIAAADPAQPYGAALPWPERERPGAAPGARRRRLRGAASSDEPVLYVERGGRGLITLSTLGGRRARRRAIRSRVAAALRALAEAVRARARAEARARAHRRRAGDRLAARRRCCSSSASRRARAGSRSAPERASRARGTAVAACAAWPRSQTWRDIRWFACSV